MLATFQKNSNPYTKLMTNYLKDNSDIKEQKLQDATLSNEFGLSDF